MGIFPVAPRHLRGLTRGSKDTHCVVQCLSSYVPMRADQYENLSALIAEGEDFDPRELYPVMAKSAAAAGWDDPDLDAYNDYDSHKKP